MGLSRGRGRGVLIPDAAAEVDLCEVCGLDPCSDCVCPACEECGCAGDPACELNQWTMFTKRTEDPKLAWLEIELREAGIPSKRDGHSWHAPILKVPAYARYEAWKILSPIDDIEDDDPRWTDY